MVSRQFDDHPLRAIAVFMEEIPKVQTSIPSSPMLDTYVGVYDTRVNDKRLQWSPIVSNVLEGRTALLGKIIMNCILWDTTISSITNVFTRCFVMTYSL